MLTETNTLVSAAEMKSVCQTFQQLCILVMVRLTDMLFRASRSEICKLSLETLSQKMNCRSTSFKCWRHVWRPAIETNTLLMMIHA